MVSRYCPTTLAEALAVRNEEKVVPFGGGTDLMISPKEGVTYLFVHRIAEMKKIYEDDEYIRIGASCTFTEVQFTPLVPKMMRDAISEIAAPAIRNAGTMGGNIGNGSAKADSVLVEYTMGAKLRLASVDGERIIPIEQFYKGRKELDLHDNELIVEILLPKTGTDNYFYQKVGARKALAISRIAFGGIIQMDGNIIKDISVAFGAVANTVLRYREIEKMLIGKTLEEAHALRPTFVKAYDDAMQLTRGRVSAEYRKTVCMNLLNAFLDDKGI